MGGLRLEGATLRVDAPRHVTVREPATFSVTCENADGPTRVRGPFLTWDGTWLARAPQWSPLERDGTTRSTLRARFSARGVHHLDGFTAAAPAPLGLVCGRPIESESLKIVVVPRIANVARLPMAVAARHQPGGVALASKSGEAMDLLGVRPYRPGDAVRDLHARSWARTGSPVVREYQQEYFTRIGVVLDTGTRDPDQLEVAIELAAGVLAHLSRGEALVDVLVAGENVHELTLGRSLGRLDQALDLLATVEPGPVLSADDVMCRLEPYLARLSRVVLLSLAEDGAKKNRGGREEQRHRLVKSIEARGVATTVIVVDDGLVRAIQRGESLAW
jgi:uncharacterized protein (DUF58 family)